MLIKHTYLQSTLTNYYNGELAKNYQDHPLLIRNREAMQTRTHTSVYHTLDPLSTTPKGCFTQNCIFNKIEYYNRFHTHARCTTV